MQFFSHLLDFSFWVITGLLVGASIKARIFVTYFYRFVALLVFYYLAQAGWGITFNATTVTTMVKIFGIQLIFVGLFGLGVIAKGSVDRLKCPI